MKLFQRFPKSKEEKRTIRRHIILSVVSGIFIGISFPPFPLNFLMFSAFIPYFFVLQERRGLAEINRITYLMNFVFTVITVYWVGSWTEEADPFLKISGILLMFANPAVYLIPSTLYYMSSRLFSKQTALFFFPIFWLASEYLFSIWDIKFPWLMLSNSQTSFLPFIQSADIAGAYGITLLILYINIFLFLFIRNLFDGNRKYSFLCTAAALIIFPLIYGNIKENNYERSERKIKVGLLQPNLNPWKKWEAGNLQEQLKMYLEMSDEVREKGAQIIFWPETALPVYLLSGNYPYEIKRIRDYVDSNRAIIITGMPHANFYKKTDKIPEDAKPLKQSGGFYTSYNSTIAFVPHENKIQKYGKIKLVPFGERVPWLDLIPFLGDIFKWNVGISSWNIGRDTTVFKLPLDNDTIKTAAVVCIESIYPDLIAQFVNRGAEFISVVTNDSWYGNSSGPYQHKEISVLRAIENRRYVVQAANGGISFVIDPLGKFMRQTKMFEKSAVVEEISLQDEVTFFSRYPLLPPLIASAFSIWVIGLFLIKLIIRKSN